MQTPPSPPPGARVLADPVDRRQRLALAAVVGAARDAGLDVADAGIWRAGSSVLVGLPRAGVLGRVDDPRRVDAACRQVVVARALAARRVPAIGLAGPAAQPVSSAAGPVTFWHWLTVTDGDPDPREMGRLARRLHDATRGGADDVPGYDPIGAVAAELARARDAGLTPDPDLALLEGHVERLRAAWPDQDEDPLGVAVVHGDLHRHNAIVTPEGLVLADLELAGVGPASADLAPTVVAVRRYGDEPGALGAFLAGYGVDLPTWPGLEVLVEAFELWATVWAVANRGGSTTLEAEAAVRLERWRPGTGGRSSRAWALR
jgi:hypothetical protein